MNEKWDENREWKRVSGFNWIKSCDKRLRPFGATSDGSRGGELGGCRFADEERRRRLGFLGAGRMSQVLQGVGCHDEAGAALAGA
jgi:hypothetical protein